MRNNSLIILEIIWITTGTLSLALAIKLAFKGGGNNIILFLLMSIISFVFAWFRHKQRKKS